MFGGLPGAGSLNLPGNDIASADELADLDNFLDNYLVHLQNDQRPGGTAAQQAGFAGAAPGMGMQGGLPAQNQLLGMPSLGLPQGLPSRQPSDMFGFGSQLGMGLGGAPMNFNPQMQPQQGAGLGLGQGAGLSGQFFGSGPMLQPAQHQLQQLQMHQLQAGIVGGISVPKVPVTTAMTEPSAVGGGAKGKGGKAAAAPAPKPARKGRAGAGAKGKPKSEPETSEDPDSGSGGDSGDSSEDEQRSKKKKEGPMDDAERKHLALQEKNRKAQRRFRERQKVRMLACEVLLLCMTVCF